VHLILSERVIWAMPRIRRLVAGALLRNSRFDLRLMMQDMYFAKWLRDRSFSQYVDLPLSIPRDHPYPLLHKPLFRNH